ncbi:MAG TPA: bacteriohopanetetrol glucosamine biosynthesis glycosyltransferase HpnI [Stellaceae bacterium]|nr:bacteriohopanetetrol glucosamine biosynthesis glycosyltransferase HpnI [Stellaceae bacterium]
MNAVALTLVLVAAWSYIVGAAVVARRFARRARPAAGDMPAISVLKPLHGLEPGLFDNLCSFADQDYPDFQLVFGVRDRTDAALPVARALTVDRPRCDIEIVVDSRVRGSNLKVANLENMLPSAPHDVIVLADSDMRVGRDYLGTVAALLADPATGLVTCAYKAVPAGGWWSQLAALHINFGFLPGALVGETLDIGGGCFGATIALRREVLEQSGGLVRLRNELGDDHRLGAAVRGLGLKTVLAPYIVENHLAEASFASLWRHELRWARTSRAMAPAGFAGSLATHTVVLTALAASLWGPSLGVWGGVVLTSLLLRWLSAGAIARALDLPRTGLWLLPLRDVLSFAVFLGSFCGRSVLWRGQLFRIDPDGHMSVEGDQSA